MPAATEAPSGPPKSEVRAALSRVAASAPFRSSKRLQKLLAFLVEEVLAGRGDSLVQYRVATEGLGLGPNFDPEKFTLVRSHAGRLRKALAAYYEGEGIADTLVITMPASGYRVGFVRVGARAARSPKNSGQPPLLVVSRFQGIGLKAGRESLPASIAEELSLRLARAAHLRVAQGERAARRPDADFVLEGSIEQRGQKLLVRPRLLDAPGGVQIWSRRYEMSADGWDPDAFEDEILDAIAVEVGCDFGKIDRHLVRQSPAQADGEGSLQFAILKTKAYESACTEAAYNEAASALRAALLKSPACATAHALLGLLLLVGHCEYFRRKHPYPPEAPGHLVIALAAEPRNPYARYARVVDSLVRREYGELAAAADEILADGDFPPGFALLACFCRLYARNATAEIRVRAARLMRQNPEYPRIIHTAFALEHLLAGDHESARRDMAVAELPGNWFGPAMQIAIHHTAGRRAEAKAARKKLLALCPDYARHGEEVLARSLHPDFVALLTEAWRASA